MSKIRIAIIKFGGMAVGGSERLLQVIAANLSLDLFEVDYYYCDAAPYLGSSGQHGNTNPDRLKYMQDNKVRIIRFEVKFRDLTKPTFDWIDTNFWEVFDETRYDLALTVKSGHPEYPFTLLKIPLVEIVGLPAGIDSKPAIHVHPSQYQRQIWLEMGGDLHKSCVIPPPPTPPQTKENLRTDLKIPAEAVVAGFHQRKDNAIFSPIPLMAFSRCSGPHRHFLLLGGGQKYREQAEELHLTNVHFMPETGDPAIVSRFLNTLDIYAHGRGDGETYGAVLAEAMLHGKPCLSHAVYNGDNAQPETIGPAGWFAADLEEYTEKLDRLYQDPLLRHSLSQKSISHAQTYFSLESCMENLTRLFLQISGQPQNALPKKRIPYGISPLGFLYAGDLDCPSHAAHHVLTQEIPDEWLIRIIKFFLPKVRRFIDIGTKTGLYSLMAAKECPAEAQIHCFAPQNQENLEKTIDLNNWEQKIFIHPLQSLFDDFPVDFLNIEQEIYERTEKIIHSNKPIILVKTDNGSWLQAQGYFMYRCKERKGRWFHFGALAKTHRVHTKQPITYLCLPIEQEPEIIPKLRSYLIQENRELMKNQLNRSRKRAIRFLKEKFKTTFLYPLFYKARNTALRALR